MKSILTDIFLYSSSLFMLTLFIPGVKISGGIPAFLIGGAALALMFLLLKPVLSIVMLPLNFITLGAFSFLINVIILYLLTLFITNISINAFEFNGFKYAGFIIPKFYVNKFFAFVAVSFFLSIIYTFLSWLTKR
ncbi:MAG: hypothetical protein A2687_01315 [Candidatus Levybacteria bacterium RIFCSPHIGHO2_01_FULL_38_26]|nr:MAG: hypothetical protein A2687_01315 [Candidatus Levybacteria bacterium RIFCSPHIGHO2_01_FULL_38_26]